MNKNQRQFWIATIGSVFILTVGGTVYYQMFQNHLKNQQIIRCVILLHEIYGVNQHMQYTAQLLFEKGYDVFVPNLLNSKVPFTYEQEAKAYENFMENVGFEQAKLQVWELIKEIVPRYEHIRIIGFSVGATVAWLCSEHPGIQKVVGFYGSRIRQYTYINPVASTILIYGEEQSFNPQHLKDVLSNVEVHIVDGMHGFADPYSIHYKPLLAEKLFYHMID